MRLPRSVITGCFACLAMVTSRAGAQASTEIIRGRIFGPDSLPIAQAEVLVTGLLTRATQTTRSDSRGVYTLLFANPENDYLVAVRKVGFVSTTFRLSRTGLSSMLGGDVYLRNAAMVLDTMFIAINRDSARPARDRRAVGEIGSSDLADSLFLMDPGKLLALLQSIPGIYSSDDSTFSVLGSAADQNITTLDGITVRGASLPPDALASTRVITGSADPARGGASGAIVSQSLRGGTDILSATIRGTNANRTLMWDDPSWIRPVPRTLNGSGTVNGPIRKGKLRFNVSWNVVDAQTDWFSLLDPRESLLAQQGISLDSVAATTQALQSIGVPLSFASIPRDATSRNVNSSSVLDFTPTATTSLRLSHNVSWQNSVNGGSVNVTAFPTRANQVGFIAHNASLRYSTYVHGLLNEMSAGMNYYSDHSDPYTQLPGGSVRVGTDFDDGRTGLTTLTFGGGSGQYYERSIYSQVQDELSWLPRSGVHKVKVGGQLSFEQSRYFYFPGSSLLGNYTYLSLADLAANKPSSYERVITDTPRSTRGSNSSIWVGEEWMQSKAFQLQGGLRFDFAYPGTLPAYNPAVETTFGRRTDFVPKNVGMSPRLGFSWSSAKRRGQGTAGGSSTLGGMSAASIASLPPELVTSILSMQRASTLPGIGVSGSFGAYRGVTSTSAIADLVESTGLAGTRINLVCVGDAIPVPDWSALTEGPTACDDGTTGSTFSIAKPLVRLYDPAYQPPLSWRGNVGVDGIRVPGKWLLSLNLGAALNRNNSSTVDLNLNRTVKFTLPAEGERPVYADVASVVPASGSISQAASRISPDFSTVNNTLSDLKGYNANLQATISPPRPIIRNRVSVSLSYTYAVSASEQRGNSRVGTDGDPFARQWVQTTQPRHMFRFTSSGRVWWFNFGVTTFMQSGVPLTPLVSGDINGDGSMSDDRAFIPDPATTTDTSLARQMSDLLAHARPGALECLLSQLGRMAGPNTCRTPWQARMDLSASVTPPSSWGYNDRLRITMNLLNASGGLVRLFGLQDTPLGRSTLSTTPTSTLLYVTGFDPATRQFRYRVNQLFGEPSNFGSARRKFPPMQLQLGFEYKFGGPPLNPLARGLGLREPVGKAPLTEAERRAAVAKLRKDPVQPILELRDSLALTANQADQLEALAREFNARADTILAPLTRWVVKKGKRVVDQDLNKHLAPAQSSLSKLTSEYGKKAQGILTLDQQSKLSPKPAARKPQ
jgi:hypothetical protein